MAGGAAVVPNRAKIFFASGTILSLMKLPFYSIMSLQILQIDIYIYIYIYIYMYIYIHILLYNDRNIIIYHQCLVIHNDQLPDLVIFLIFLRTSH